jgi:hypothetical protein
MNPSAKLTNPYAIKWAAFGKAVQFNKVYSPKSSSLHATGVAVQRMNATC